MSLSDKITNFIIADDTGIIPACDVKLAVPEIKKSILKNFHYNEKMQTWHIDHFQMFRDLDEIFGSKLTGEQKI